MKSKTEKRPWVNFPHIWKSEAAFMAFLRGGIRQSVWNRYPVKLEFVKKNRKRIKNPNPKGKVATVWGGNCSLCHRDFPSKDLQVDHVEGHFSLKTIDDLQSFVEGLTFLTTADLAFVCKPCHTIKSYSEKMGISFEEATLEKKVIQFSKLTPADQKRKLKDRGYSDLEISSGPKRKDAYRNILKEGK